MALTPDEMSAARLSRQPIANNEWPQPELSLGAPNGSMDIMNRYKFWEIKKNSPAHHVWRTISETMINLLEDQFEHLDAEDTDITVEMFMIARKMEKPSPTILFRSQSKAVRHTAMEIVNKSSLLAPYPGVMMASCSLLPRPLVMEDVLGIPALPPGVYSSDALRHCGVSTVISGEQGGSLRKATLGGIVCIDGLFYGMTTARACFGDPGSAIDLEAELDFALYGLEGLDEAADEEYESVEMTSKGSVSSSSTSQPESQRGSASSRPHLSPFTSPTRDKFPGSSPGGKSSPRFGGFFSSSSERTLNKYAKVGDSSSEISPRLGSVFVSAPERGLNWALVAIENSDLMLEKISLNNRRFMVNSIYWRNQSLHTIALNPKRLASEPADIEVLICTGNRDDPLEGRLSASPSFQRIPGKNAFQELWVVKCIHGKFSDGDSGAWVVGCESGDLYGIITSGYPGTETAYITPAVEIFEDIDNYFGQQVDFSTPELWSSANRPAKNRGRGLPIRPSLNLATSAEQRRQESFPRRRESPPRTPIRERRIEAQRPQSIGSVQTTVTEATSIHPTSEPDEKPQALEARSPTSINISPTKELLVEPMDERLLTATPPWASKTPGSSVSASSTGSAPSPRAALRASYRASHRASGFGNESIDSGYQNPPCNNLYVRNLPPTPSEFELRALFSEMPGFKSLRMKLTEPECFVLFEDTISASQALHKLDDYRFHPEDRWGIMVGFARSIPRSGQTILTIEEEECVLPEVYMPEESSLPEVYYPPEESSLPEVYHPEPLLEERQLSMDMEAPSPATSRRGRFAQLLAPGRSASKSRRRSIGSLSFSDAGSMSGVIPPVAVVDKKKEKQERERKEKQEKKERKALERKKARELEKKMMATTDHNVRWGP